MASKLRTLYMVIFDYVTLLICYTGCLLVLPSKAVATNYIDWLLGIAVAAGTMFVCYFAVFKITGIYNIIHRYAQSAEYLRFFSTFFFGGAVYVATMSVAGIIFPEIAYRLSFLIIHSCLASCMLLMTRIVYRVYVNRVDTDDKADAKNTLIVGCGQACLMLLNELKYHPEYGIRPVVAVDRNPALVGRSIAGIKIEGTDDEIPKMCEKYAIELIIVAVPSADNKQRADILAKCAGVKVKVQMLPRVADFYATKSKVVDKLRDITTDELLGRDPIEINHKEVNEFIKGKTVLVTGGGGSIGSELCRQIAHNNPKKLVIVDIYENNAYDIEQELCYKYGKALDFETIIASVRDYDRMCSIMATYTPDIVIHAAAHKHVPLMEAAPQEAIKNNVVGTYNTARAAIKSGVGKFILISTDKAVNPTNIMGASKRLCEMVIQSLNGQGTVFSAVRFGNVLGSNGSVIPLFKKQIEAGGPVTVTHPEIIRFFMTIPEACQLVLLASTKACGGEIFVLNMGEPVKIADLAKRLIEMSGKSIAIEFTGLRPGEKLYEELMMSDENLEKTDNDKIFVGHFVDFDSATVKNEISQLESIANNNSIPQAQMLETLEKKIIEIVPTFHRT